MSAQVNQTFANDENLCIGISSKMGWVDDFRKRSGCGLKRAF